MTTTIRTLMVLLAFACPSAAYTEGVEQLHHPAPPAQPIDAYVKAATECRAGCGGRTDGCQESYGSAVLAASPGMRLYRDSLAVTRSWPGADTSGLSAEPEWEIKTVPENDDRPVSISVKPILGTCIGRDPHKQSRTHYEWTAVQGPP